MRFLPCVPALLLLAAPLCNLQAADPNGYTAQYECRAGGPKCNVDVATLASQSCDQIILPSDSNWSKITNNQSANIFCIQAGDHSSKGPLTISFSGASSRYKVLRYYRSNDANDEPWSQSAANQAKINRIKFVGANYWIVHRLVFDPNYASDSAPIHLADGYARSTRIIINRVLAQHGWRQVYVQGARDSTIQNSVFRDSIKRVGVDADGIGINWGAQGISVVNNEIYRIHSHGFYIADNAGTQDIVIENNDIYTDAATQHTNCAGSYSPTDPNWGKCADSEAAIGLKTGGASGAPIIVKHNRVWGYRRTDTSVCCISGTQGQMISLTSADTTDAGARYVLVQNNIIADGQHGIQTPRELPRYHSIIGNIVYRIKDYYAPLGNIGSHAFSSLGHWDYNEVYFNTVVDSDTWANIGGGNTKLEVKCNAIVASGPATGGTPDGSTVVNYNGFIGTQKFTTDVGTDTNVTRNITTRSNSTSYVVGSVVQLAPITACRTGKESACFLYQANTTGISAPSAPGACTDLGCEFHDGGVTWKAVRAPYFYKRKLRTVPGGETTFAPYARVHVSAPEASACHSQIGTTGGIGVSDEPTL